MMEKIRTFIAIPLPPEILKGIGALINEMRPLAPDVKWVRPESIHLTLKFLGNLTPEELQKLFSGMDEVFREQWGNFSLQAGGVGAFPNFRRPRVLWVGLREPGMEELRKLQGRIEEKLAVQGFPKEERAFSP
ncbi:MAG: RNA 2',3'-cyclic phosphodiesterase, partial [Calditrichia bacterium]